MYKKMKSDENCTETPTSRNIEIQNIWCFRLYSYRIWNSSIYDNIHINQK